MFSVFTSQVTPMPRDASGDERSLAKITVIASPLANYAIHAKRSSAGRYYLTPLTFSPLRWASCLAQFQPQPPSAHIFTVPPLYGSKPCQPNHLTDAVHLMSPLIPISQIRPHQTSGTIDLFVIQFMFWTSDCFRDISEKYTHVLPFNALTVSHFSLSCDQIYRPAALLRWPHLLEQRTPSIFIKVSGEERKMTAICGLTLTVFPPLCSAGKLHLLPAKRFVSNR